MPSVSMNMSVNGYDVYTHNSNPVTQKLNRSEEETEQTADRKGEKSRAEQRDSEIVRNSRLLYFATLFINFSKMHLTRDFKDRTLLHTHN